MCTQTRTHTTQTETTTRVRGPLLTLGPQTPDPPQTQPAKTKSTQLTRPASLLCFGNSLPLLAQLPSRLQLHLSRAVLCRRLQLRHLHSSSQFTEKHTSPGSPTLHHRTYVHMSRTPYLRFVLPFAFIRAFGHLECVCGAWETPGDGCERRSTHPRTHLKEATPAPLPLRTHMCAHTPQRPHRHRRHPQCVC